MWPLTDTWNFYAFEVLGQFEGFRLFEISSLNMCAITVIVIMCDCCYCRYSRSWPAYWPFHLFLFSCTLEQWFASGQSGLTLPWFHGEAHPISLLHICTRTSYTIYLGIAKMAVSICTGRVAPCSPVANQFPFSSDHSPPLLLPSDDMQRLRSLPLLTATVLVPLASSDSY